VAESKPKSSVARPKPPVARPEQKSQVAVSELKPPVELKPESPVARPEPPVPVLPKLEPPVAESKPPKPPVARPEPPVAVLPKLEPSELKLPVAAPVAYTSMAPQKSTSNTGHTTKKSTTKKSTAKKSTAKKSSPVDEKSSYRRRVNFFQDFIDSGSQRSESRNRPNGTKRNRSSSKSKSNQRSTKINKSESRQSSKPRSTKRNKSEKKLERSIRR
ncbi:MAG: hypothetical protein LBI37_00915, partial [Puniceicoccales bacterium]|jgi:hypothetical protein|nr:hypothetical protein [Puniceicoccales bacterium]